jgi:CRP-like cAMP-binding protein
MFYVIFSGAVEIKIRDADTKTEITVSRLGEGGGFGSIDYETTGNDLLRQHTVSATVMTELMCMQAKDYFRLMKESHDEAATHKLAFLSRIPQFAAISNDHLQENLSPSLTSKKFPINTTIYHQGERAINTYLVLRGELSLFRKETVDSREVNVLTRRVGPLEVRIEGIPPPMSRPVVLKYDSH